MGAAALDLGVPSGYIWDRIEMATPTEPKVLDEVFGRGADWVADARAADHVLMAAG